MPLRYLNLGEPQYVPQYNTLDTNLINTVDSQIEQQGQLARQASSGLFQNLQEQIIGGLQGLPEEFQAEAAGLVDQSRSKIDEIFESRGARHSLPAIQREAERVSSELRPYQQVAGQAQAYRQRIDEVGADKNVDSRVRQYLKSQGQVIRDEDGNLKFNAPDTSLLDNWRDLHSLASETIRNVEANVEESGVHLQEGEDFYQRVRHKYRDFDRLQAVGVSRLLSDREAVNQMRLTLEADGYVFQGGIAHSYNEEGELEPITIEQNGVTYELTENEALENEAVRIVNPAAAERTMVQREFSYTTRNPLYFSALENDAPNQGFLTQPISTVAGIQPIDKPLELDNEIKSGYENYNSLLSELEERGIIQMTSDEGLGQYRVLDEGRYNSRRANLQGIRQHIKSQEKRRERLQMLAFQNYYGDSVNEENLDNFIYAIREGSEEFQKAEQEIRNSMIEYGIVHIEPGRFPKINGKRLTVEEILEMAINGETSRSLGLDSYFRQGRSEARAQRLINELDDKLNRINNRYNDFIDRTLNRLSPEYQSYSDLLKLDAKGRTTEIPVIHPTNDDVFKTADRLMSRLIQPTSRRTASNDVKWINTDRAHQSIFETGDDEKIGSYEFSGFSYHPDSGEPIALYSALDNDTERALGTVYVSATKSFRDQIPVNNEFAKESYYNNMINTIASSPSREGEVGLILKDVEEVIGRPIDISVHISSPIRHITEEGIPLAREDEEIRVSITRGGSTEVHTFDPNTNDAIMYIKDLENRIRHSLLRQHREQ